MCHVAHKVSSVSESNPGRCSEGRGAAVHMRGGVPGVYVVRACGSNAASDASGEQSNACGRFGMVMVES